MFIQHRSLCLASSSPRRQEFLRRYNLQYKTCIPDIDESKKSEESVEDFVKRMSLEKAMDVYNECPESIILAGDTIVFHNQRVLGKPKDMEQAYQMLQQLSGQTHSVYSGYAIVDGNTKQSIVDVLHTKVTFQKLSEKLMHWYIRTGEPMDKAGSYSIQGIGTMLVESIEGSYNNVVGFPIECILGHLLQQGWIVYDYR